MARRIIAAVTASRADYAICRFVLEKLRMDPELKLHLIVSGMHLSPEFGLTSRLIEADGFQIGDRVEMLLSSDTPQSIAASMGLGTIGFAHCYSRLKPDLLMVSGDRFEVLAAALAAVPFRIPIAHIEGGDLTEGAIDDVFRHAITKLSHLHFVSTQEYARRVIQMGEEPWRVTVSGAPSLDALRNLRIPNPHELASKYGLKREPAPLLVTFHPVTLEPDRAQEQISEVLEAIKMIHRPVLFTLPNADTGGRIIAGRIREFVNHNPDSVLVENLGVQAYIGMMSWAAAMVGNSSSGLIEAPSLKLPCVNIGDRQRSRVRAANVIDVGNDRAEIVRGIKKALDPEFRKSLKDLVNPYHAGAASETIAARLMSVPLDGALVFKRFRDLEGTSGDDNSKRFQEEVR